MVIAVSVLAIILLLLIIIGCYLIYFALSRSYFEKHILPKEENAEQLKKDMEALTASSELVYINSYDGLKLAGYYQAAKSPSHLYFITMHGYHAFPCEVSQYAYHMKDNFNFNILIPNQRSHGLSDGKFITMGYKEKFDLQAWINYIVQKDNDAKILLHGVSMGAATVMQVSNLDLPKNVVAIIEDCGYTSCHDEFVHELKVNYNLPPFPILNVTTILSKLRLGFFFKQADSLKAVRETKLPMLFIHGDADNFVPFWMLQPLYDAKKDKKEICIIKGAEHAVAQKVDPDNYYLAVDNFTKKYFEL